MDYDPPDFMKLSLDDLLQQLNAFLATKTNQPLSTWWDTFQKKIKTIDRKKELAAADESAHNESVHAAADKEFNKYGGRSRRFRKSRRRSRKTRR